MIRFVAKVIHIDKVERIVRYRVMAESPEEAAVIVTTIEDDEPRKIQVGDAVIISNPNGSYDGYFIYDVGLKPVKVTEPEQRFWRFHTFNRPDRTDGIDAVMQKLSADV